MEIDTSANQGASSDSQTVLDSPFSPREPSMESWEGVDLAPFKAYFKSLNTSLAKVKHDVLPLKAPPLAKAALRIFLNSVKLSSMCDIGEIKIDQRHPAFLEIAKALSVLPSYNELTGLSLEGIDNIEILTLANILYNGPMFTVDDTPGAAAFLLSRLAPDQANNMEPRNGALAFASILELNDGRLFTESTADLKALNDRVRLLNLDPSEWIMPARARDFRAPFNIQATVVRFSLIQALSDAVNNIKRLGPDTVTRFIADPELFCQFDLIAFLKHFDVPIDPAWCTSKVSTVTFFTETLHNLLATPQAWSMHYLTHDDCPLSSKWYPFMRQQQYLALSTDNVDDVNEFSALPVDAQRQALADMANTLVTDAGESTMLFWTNLPTQLPHMDRLQLAGLCNSKRMFGCFGEGGDITNDRREMLRQLYSHVVLCTTEPQIFREIARELGVTPLYPELNAASFAVGFGPHNGTPANPNITPEMGHADATHRRLPTETSLGVEKVEKARRLLAAAHGPAVKSTIGFPSTSTFQSSILGTTPTRNQHSTQPYMRPLASPGRNGSGNPFTGGHTPAPSPSLAFGRMSFGTPTAAPATKRTVVNPYMQAMLNTGATPHFALPALAPGQTRTVAHAMNGVTLVYENIKTIPETGTPAVIAFHRNHVVAFAHNLPLGSVIIGFEPYAVEQFCTTEGIAPGDLTVGLLLTLPRITLRVHNHGYNGNLAVEILETNANGSTFLAEPGARHFPPAGTRANLRVPSRGIFILSPEALIAYNEARQPTHTASSGYGYLGMDTFRSPLGTKRSFSPPHGEHQTSEDGGEPGAPPATRASQSGTILLASGYEANKYEKHTEIELLAPFMRHALPEGRLNLMTDFQPRTISMYVGGMLHKNFTALLESQPDSLAIYGALCIHKVKDNSMVLTRAFNFGFLSRATMATTVGALYLDYFLPHRDGVLYITSIRHLVTAIQFLNQFYFLLYGWNEILGAVERWLMPNAVSTTPRSFEYCANVTYATLAEIGRLVRYVGPHDPTAFQQLVRDIAVKHAEGTHDLAAENSWKESMRNFASSEYVPHPPANYSDFTPVVNHSSRQQEARDNRYNRDTHDSRDNRDRRSDGHDKRPRNTGPTSAAPGAAKYPSKKDVSDQKLREANITIPVGYRTVTHELCMIDLRYCMASHGKGVDFETPLLPCGKMGAHENTRTPPRLHLCELPQHYPEGYPRDYAKAQVIRENKSKIHMIKVCNSKIDKDPRFVD